MKKIGIALLLICVLTFAVLISCKKEESKGDDTTAQTTATVTEPDTTAPRNFNDDDDDYKSPFEGGETTPSDVKGMEVGEDIRKTGNY